MTTHEPLFYSLFLVDTDACPRLDLFVTEKTKLCSRSRASALIQEGFVLVDGKKKKPGYKVRPGENVRVTIPQPKSPSFAPENIEIPILFEDKSIIVVNKPPGMVVHPGPGHYSGTLVNGLLYKCPDLSGIGDEIRPGIVHRLDKDTSGAMVVAKTQHAHGELSRQFKERLIRKKYLALVWGRMSAQHGEINVPIGRDPVNRKIISTRSRNPRHSETHWQIKEEYQKFTLLEVKILTGRTHQIRVHLASMGFPIVGDPVYCKKSAGRIKDKELKSLIAGIGRQMLHSTILGLNHPVTGKKMAFQAPLFDDMADILQNLRANY